MLGLQLRLTSAEVQKVALLTDQQQFASRAIPRPFGLAGPAKPAAGDPMAEALRSWCELYQQSNHQAPTAEAAMAAMRTALDRHRSALRSALDM